MFGSLAGRTRSLWRRFNRLDRLGLLVVLLYGVVTVARAFRKEIPGAGFLGFLFFVVLAYFLFRLAGWARSRLLWGLRNRLIVAYVFIAVVPVLLLLVMAVLSAYILYWQLGAYLIYDDFQKHVEKVAAAADTVAASLATEARLVGERPSPSSSSTRLAALMAGAGLPGLHIEFNTGQELLARNGGAAGNRFAGIVQSGSQLWLRAVVARPSPGGRVVVSASVSVSPELMESVAPGIGPIQVGVTRPATEEDPKNVVLTIGEHGFVRVGQIATRQRVLPPKAYWLDGQINGVSKLEARLLGAAPGTQDTVPVFAFFSTRPSQLNRRLFSSLGEIGGATVTILMFIGIVFLVIEVAALVTGIVLTRTITHAVADLYRATQYVQAGDLTHRVRVERRDQLGLLGESFNSMTSSISGLIEEQRERQRLENELSIAREVQAQLFPRALPSLPGVQLEAICRAARMVSGDYYDFIRLGPTRLAIVIADISGKGISAALLMASLQAALRSQILLEGGSTQSTAELAARLNRHLYLHTSQERYATFFCAVYDSTTRILRYTNAGHFPPLYIAGGKVTKLEEGGMVVGLFDNCSYQEGSIQVASGSLLVAYSDGLIEPENVYGEEFGTGRLLEVTLRHREASPQALAQALMRAAEEWASSPEQADDMTVIVARLE